MSRRAVSVFALGAVIGAIALVAPTSAGASDDGDSASIPQPTITAWVINDATGERIDIPPTQLVTTVDGGGAVTVRAVLDTEAALGTITALADTGTYDGEDVVARVNINYDLRNSGAEIRFNRVWGSWTPKSSLTQVWAREVYYTDQGVPTGHNASKVPTSNSFTYTTGWGWVAYYPVTAYSGARAETYAKYAIPGMSPTLTIHVAVTI